MTALHDEQTRNRCKQGFKQQEIKRWLNVIFWCSAKQATTVSTNHLAVFDLDAVVIICVERGSEIHGIRPLDKLTVGDVHRTLCKQKRTSALCATNGDRNTSNRLLDLSFTADKVRTFRNYQLCLFQLNVIVQHMWRVLKYMSNP